MLRMRNAQQRKNAVYCAELSSKTTPRTLRIPIGGVWQRLKYKCVCQNLQGRKGENGRSQLGCASSTNAYNFLMSERERNEKEKEERGISRSVRNFRHCARSALISILYHQTETQAHKGETAKANVLARWKTAPAFNPSENKTQTIGSRWRVEVGERVEEKDWKANCPPVKGEQDYSSIAKGTVRSKKIQQQFFATLKHLRLSLQLFRRSHLEKIRTTIAWPTDGKNLISVFDAATCYR